MFWATPALWRPGPTSRPGPTLKTLLADSATFAAVALRCCRPAAALLPLSLLPCSRQNCITSPQRSSGSSFQRASERLCPATPPHAACSAAVALRITLFPACPYIAVGHSSAHPSASASDSTDGSMSLKLQMSPDCSARGATASGRNCSCSSDAVSMASSTAGSAQILTIKNTKHTGEAIKKQNTTVVWRKLLVQQQRHGLVQRRVCTSTAVCLPTRH